jgi:hypothetical protein
MNIVDSVLPENTQPVKAATYRKKPIGLLLAVGLSIFGTVTVAGLNTAKATDSVVEFKPAAMTYTNTASPKTVYNSSADTMVSKSQFSTYLKFDTSKIAATSTIVAAELQVTVTTSQATTPALWVGSTDPKPVYEKMSYATRAPTTSGGLNPGDKATASTGKTVTTKLTGLANTKPGAWASMRIGYTAAGSALHLSKTTAPVLRLSVRSAAASSTAPSSSAPSSSAPSAPVMAPASDDLPYTVAKTGSSTKKVFGHYFPPYPISIDNKAASVDYYTRNYLSPTGENSKFAATGGLLRDRPNPRAPLPGNFELADATTEVKQASAAGLDGFVINIMGWTGNSWTRALQMTKAAKASGTGFVTVPMIDGSSSATGVTPAVMATNLTLFYNTPGAYRMSDGRYLLSTFKAEGKPATYWKDVITALKTDHGINVAFVGVFNSLTDARITEYAPISYALGIWGARDPAAVLNMPDRAAAVRKYGVKWMAPIAIQDVRHWTTSYAEADNTELLRASWETAIEQGADMVQLVTWNDYSESTGFASSEAHHNTFLDLNGYYATQFKTGQKPTLTGDELILTHRIQKVTTQPTKQTAKMDPTLAGSKVTPRDTVEIASLLKAPATVSLTVGGKTTSYNAPAGVSTYTVPLTTGTVSAQAIRGNTIIKTVTSTHPVVSTIDYWDLQYYAASSRENPSNP